LKVIRSSKEKIVPLAFIYFWVYDEATWKCKFRLYNLVIHLFVSFLAADNIYDVLTCSTSVADASP